MAETRPLACDELVVIVTDYLEGVMDPAERARFDAHLDDCPDCVVYVDQFRRTLETIGTLDEDDVAPAARDTLLAAFRDWRASRPAEPAGDGPQTPA